MYGKITSSTSGAAKTHVRARGTRLPPTAFIPSPLLRSDGMVPRVIDFSIGVLGEVLSPRLFSGLGSKLEHPL